MKSINLTLLTILLLTFISSCNNKLTRDKAEEILKNNNTILTYKDGRVSLPKISLNDAIFRNYNMTEYQQNGFFTVSNTQEVNSGTGQSWNWVTIVPTEKTTPYLLETTSCCYIVKAFDFKFGKVTGIAEDESGKNAEVEYTIIKINQTPFLNLYNGEKESSNSYKINFTKYDDGWRVK